MQKSKIILIVLLLSLFSSINNLIAQDSRKNDFRLSLGGKYLSRFTTYGIDLAQESAAYGLSASLRHVSGLYTDAYFSTPTNSDIDAQQTAVDIGYEYEFTDKFSVSAEFSQYFYSSDSANIFSQFDNSLSINAALELEVFDLGFSYDTFLGGDGASYFGIDISSFYEVGHLYILPMYQMVFMSQTVDQNILLKGKSKKKINQTTSTTTEISGLANSIITVAAIYPLLDNLSLSFTPTLIISHNDELSSESSLFVWNAGLRYRLKFWIFSIHYSSWNL